MTEPSIAAFVGDIPQYYQRGLGPVIFEDYALEMAARVSAASPARVLETAAGTGIVTRALRDAMPRAAITATDLNGAMLDVARTKFDVADKVVFATADAQALPYGAASVDALVCQFGLMFFPDKPRFFAEAHRVIAPGGRYFFSVWDSHARNRYGALADAFVREVFPADPPNFYAVPFSCAAMDPIKNDLEEAGFTDIVAEVLHIDKRVDDLAMFARGLLFGNPVATQIRARGEPSPEALHGRLVDILAAEFGTSPAVVPLQTIFWTARRA